jgi:hypothetical protein
MPGRALRRATQKRGQGSDRQQDGAEQAPVDEGHRENLETLLDLVRMSIELEDHCGYGDPTQGEQRNRAAVLAHFGDLEGPLDEWDVRVDRVRAAPGSLWGWFERTAERLGISEPPFAVGALIDRLALLTADRARLGQLDVPHELHIQHFNDRLAGRERVSLYVEGQNVGQIDGQPRASLAKRLDTAHRQIQKLFDGAQTSAQAIAIGSARDALMDLKLPLLNHLAQEAAADSIWFVEACPVCRPPEPQQPPA